MDMTGLNPIVAKQQIYDFYGSGKMIATDFENKYLFPFFRNIGKAWTSPKAVEFGNKHLHEVMLCFETYTDAIHNICVRAESAYNSLATSNGAPTIQDEQFMEETDTRALWNDGSLGLTEPSIYFQEASPEGIVGMDVKEVNNQVETFKGGVNDFINAVNSLPLTIAFYDPNGELQAGYEQMITKAVSDITTTTNNMYDAINTAISEEVVIIKEASISAQESLESSNM